MALGTIDTHSEWHHVRWSYPDSVQCLPICSIYSAHCDAHSSSTPRACDRTHRRSPLSLSIGSRKEICRSAPRPRHHVAPAPTSVDGTLPPTLGPAPDNQCHNQRLDPGAEPDPPPPRQPSTWLALARPCRALRRSASPGSPPRVRPNGAFVEKSQ